MERNKNPPPFSLEGPGREVPQLRDMALGVAMVVCLLFKGRSFPFFLFFFFFLTVTLKNVKILFLEVEVAPGKDQSKECVD